MTPVDIPALIPHAGSMCLLDSVVSWSEGAILCIATSHLSPANPLRRNGRLSAVCGIEYALQAAALHGALRGGRPQPPGYLAALRMNSLSPDPIDDPAFGALLAEARLEHGDDTGLIYAIGLRTEGGRTLLDGRATIILGALALGAPGLGAPGLGAPGLGAPGLGAPGLGAPGLGVR
jgi:predicted hotdog family 3-hydroxylacyl-ACP dehydratase